MPKLKKKPTGMPAKKAVKEKLFNALFLVVCYADTPSVFFQLNIKNLELKLKALTINLLASLLLSFNRRYA
jgi:hypothetical protein